MATKEDQDTLRLLVQHVSRAFYEAKYTVILDQLARNPVLKEDDLASRMGLQAKELNKLTAVLATDRLVHIYRQNELKEGAQRAVGRQYYYIDYHHFCNVVKWRVSEMRRIIDASLRNELDNKGYICPQCRKSYSPLDVDKLMDYSLGAFICEICHAELVDNEDAETVRGSQDRMQRFNKQMTFIREGLRKSESMVLPAFDAALWIKNHPTDGDLRKVEPQTSLKIAGSGPGSGMDDDGIEIMMSLDKDEMTRKRERDAEAAAKRQQNALPSWHLKSTISGDLTALGVKEVERGTLINGTSSGVAGGSHDEMLRGLGTVGSSRMEKVDIAPEEVKVVVNHESDYYDQYYASLAASSAPSTRDTPSALGGPGSDEGDEEEERKPSVQYLDSLNEYRKRLRSEKDEEGLGSKKIAKTNDAQNGDESSPDSQTTPDQEVVGDDEEPEPESPTVYVNGKPMPFSEVTEEDQELMTPEEYTAYFEVIQSRS